MGLLNGKWNLFSRKGRRTTVDAEEIPPGVDPQDHREGMERRVKRILWPVRIGIGGGSASCGGAGFLLYSVGE